MEVSFIIPAHNEAATLGSTLHAITAAAATVFDAQTPVRADSALGSVGMPGPPDGSERLWEIIVVADGCTDGTVDVARRHPGPVRVIEVNLRQIGAVRNAGARTAAGEVLIFVDADTRPDASLLSATMRVMRLPAVNAGARRRDASGTAIVGGGCRVRFDFMRRWSGRVLARASSWIYWKCGLAAGCYLFVRRDAFEAVGGFDETWFATEEVWLSRALKRQGRFVVLPEMVQTSARKIEGLSALQMLGLLIRTLSRGAAGLQQREGLDIWYRQRQQAAPAPVPADESASASDAGASAAPDHARSADRGRAR